MRSDGPALGGGMLLDESEPLQLHGAPGVVQHGCTGMGIYEKVIIK